jgi:hypothetical protein
MALNEDKLRSLLESYNVQQRECGDLQVQVDQKEADIQMKRRQIDRMKNTIEDELKPELIRRQKEETSLLENSKNLEEEMKFEKSDKNKSYLKIVAAEGKNSDEENCHGMKIH